MNFKQPQQASTRVLFNTGVLYAKMLITMGISLYSTRIVLNALGESDYGIFNLIAGIIAMLSFLNAAMTISTQRYLSFHQGTGDFEMQKKIFTNSWILHIAIGVIVVALLLILTPFLFNGFLNIHADRIPTAKALYYFMSVSIFFTIIAVPFTASLNAHENMLWIAVVNIIEAFIKLAIALSLIYFIQNERLIVYGILMAILSVISFTLYATYCLKKYSECNVRNYQVDKPLIKELGGFAGWNLFGAIAYQSRVQGLAIVFNYFFNSVINAAFGIATQIFAQVSYLSASLVQSFSPQLMSSEGCNNRRKMLNISMLASKYTFFISAIVAIPLIFEMPTILKLWLKEVPAYTATFSSLMLVALLFNQITIGCQQIFQAIGKIKFFMFFMGNLYLLNLPLSFLLLMYGISINYILFSFIGIEFVGSIFKIIYVSKTIHLPIKEYIVIVIKPNIIPILLAIIVCGVMIYSFLFTYRFIVTIVVSSAFTIISFFYWGLSKYEKTFVCNQIKKRFNTIFKNENRNIDISLGT